MATADIATWVGPVFDKAGVPQSHWSTKGRSIHLLMGRGARTRMVKATMAKDWSRETCIEQVEQLVRRYMAERAMAPR